MPFCSCYICHLSLYVCNNPVHHGWRGQVAFHSLCHRSCSWPDWMWLAQGLKGPVEQYISRSVSISPLDPSHLLDLFNLMMVTKTTVLPTQKEFSRFPTSRTYVGRCALPLPTTQPYFLLVINHKTNGGICCCSLNDASFNPWNRLSYILSK